MAGEAASAVGDHGAPAAHLPPVGPEEAAEHVAAVRAQAHVVCADVGVPCAPPQVLQGGHDGLGGAVGAIQASVFGPPAGRVWGFQGRV